MNPGRLVEVYPKRPNKALVFRCDEQRQVQALEHTRPRLSREHLSDPVPHGKLNYLQDAGSDQVKAGIRLG
ncbi:hypothetical protein IBA8403_24150 [Pseudomonas syringae]